MIEKIYHIPTFRNCTDSKRNSNQYNMRKDKKDDSSFFDKIFLSEIEKSREFKK